MKSGGIQDIVIERGNEKKKNTGIKVVIFIFIIILAFFIGTYYYLTNLNKISAKELFVTNISKSNIRQFLQKDIYSTTIEKLETKDFETNTNINFTTTLKNEEFKNVDVSKLSLEILNKNDVDNSKSSAEAILNYAENEIFRLKMLSNESTIALFLNEINDKYIGCNYENLQNTLGIDYNNNINDFKQLEKIDITEEEKDKYIKKYFSKIIDNIPEEKFSIQENIVIKKDDASVDVTAYTVNLSKEELNKVIKEFLITLKDDEELLKEFAGIESIKAENQETESTEKVEDYQEIIPEENEIEEFPEDNTEEILEENSEEQTSNNEELVSDTTVEENNQESENGEDTGIPVITINPVGTINSVNITESNKEIISSMSDREKTLETDSFASSNLLINLLTGKKLNKTIEELKELIENVINLEEYYEVDASQESKVLTVNVYASQERTEKITVEFLNEISIDLELEQKSAKENGIKITFLQKEDGKRNGFSLNLNKIQNDANTTIKAIYNVIENEEINKKITIDLKTDGTINSKEIKNDIVLTISTSEGENKVVIENIIQYKNVEGIEELVPENCLYLDQLSEEELITTLDDLKNKTENLYNDKKENLNFINTNTGGITLEDISSKVTREDAKNALITKVSNMMQEAIDNNQEFTIKNLENLTIDGFEVSSTVTEENAKIVVDTYSFNIDQNFTLTDSE